MVPVEHTKQQMSVNGSIKQCNPKHVYSEARPTVFSRAYYLVSAFRIAV